MVGAVAARTPHVFRRAKWLGVGMCVATLAVFAFVPAWADAARALQVRTAPIRAMSPPSAVHGTATEHLEGAAPPRLWVVQVSRGARGWFDRTILQRVRQDGINAIALRISALGPRAAGEKALGSVRRFAVAEKLYLIAVVAAGRPRTPAARQALAACSSRRFPLLRCALQTRSVASAARLARKYSSVRRLVAIYVEGPGRLAQLARLPNSLRRRILVIAPLYKRFGNASAWGTAIGQTAASPSLYLGVAPQTRKASASVLRFAAMLSGGGAAAGAVGDSEPPSMPTGLEISHVGSAGVILSWNASADNVGVTGYRLFVNGIQVGSSLTTSYLFSGLSCQTAYTLGVAAVNAAGNVSSVATMIAHTTACSDTQPPSTPIGLATSGVGQTSVTLSWNASADNVGVAGYRLSLNGSQVGSSNSTSYSFTGLTCATSYTFGVTAYDAAGNVSGTATLGAPTSPCSGSGAAVYLSPSGSDGSCVRGDSAHPCATPTRAWAVAQSGDTISVADGTYTSGCTLNGDKTATTTFVGSSSSNVKFVCDVTMNGAHAAFQNVGMYQFDDEANNVTLMNVDLTCANSAPYKLYTPGNKCSSTWEVEANNFTWNGGSWGPLYDSESVCGGNSPNIPLVGFDKQVQNVSITGVYAHEVAVGCSSQHTELMRIDGGSNITLSRDFFHYCGNSACIFVSNESGTVPSKISIVNTICDGTGLGGDCLDLNFGGTHGTTGSILENDTFLGGIAIEPADTYANGDLTIANTIWLGANGCSSAPTYHNNAPFQPDYGGTTDNCGDPNQVAVGNHSDNDGPPSSWLACGAGCAAGGTGLDYSVKSGSPLLHAGSASYMPSVDYAGNPRPCSSQTQPNVGAYERACS
jgi:chitodextrinase